MVQKVKKISIVILSLFMFSACHGALVPKTSAPTKVETPLFEVPTEFDTTKNYELDFWSKNDNNEIQKETYKNAIAQFEKLYPNIKVKIRNYTNYEDIYKDVLKNIPTKSTPNICVSYPDYAATYKSGVDTIVELDSLMNDPKFGFGGTDLRFDAPTKEEIVTKFFDEGLLRNDLSETGYSHFIVPFVRSNEVLYLNKTYFEEHNLEIPEQFTWDYLYDVCRYARNYYDKNVAKPDEKKDTFSPLIYKSKDNYLIQVAKQYDYPFTTENGDILFNNSDVKAFLTMINQYGMMNDRIIDVFPNSDYPGNRMNHGTCIMGIDSSAGATWIGSEAPLTEYEATTRYEVLVTNLPQKDLNDTKIISQGPSFCIFYKEDPQEVLASWLFSLFMLTNEVQIAYSKTEGYCPVTYKAINSEEFQDYLNNPGEIYRPDGMSDEEYASNYYVKIQATKNVIANIDNSFVTPAFKGSALARTAVGDLIQGVMFLSDFNQDKLEVLIKKKIKEVTM